MADPLSFVVSVAAIISSTAGLIDSYDAIIGRVKGMHEVLYRQSKEIKVLLLVLEECRITLSSVSPHAVPPSIEQGMQLVVERLDEVKALRDSIESRAKKLNKFKPMILIHSRKVLRAHDEQKIAVDGFRDSVLFLRDLTSEWVHKVKLKKIVYLTLRCIVSEPINNSHR
jgi:hypothetical protein